MTDTDFRYRRVGHRRVARMLLSSPKLECFAPCVRCPVEAAASLEPVGRCSPNGNVDGGTPGSSPRLAPVPSRGAMWLSVCTVYIVVG